MSRDVPLRPSTTAVWISVLGTLAVVAALAGAREFLVPVAFAGLLTFVMSPPVDWLERRIGRVPAVIGAVCVMFALLLGSGWMLVRQLDGVATALPKYRATLLAKVSQLRSMSGGGTVGELQKTIDSVQRDLKAPDRETRAARVVIAEEAADQSPFGMLGPVLGMAASAGLVIALVMFMLLERRDLRDRIVSVAGHGHAALTTRALDEAGQRVARQLLMQTLGNAIYGVTAGTGLWLLGVPYPVVWASLGAVLRFVPYVGPLVGVAAPIVISVAAMDGWRGPLMVLGFMLALELFTNLVVETVLYAGAAGVSQVGLLVAVTFWTWLWGPMGLVMAIPLTVCVVVLGKHVRGLEYLATLMADTSTLSPAQVFYQRLIVRDTNEASDLVERHLATQEPRSLYDALILPALAQSEIDRLQGRLDAEAQQQLVAAAREILADAGELVRRAVENTEGEPAAEVPVEVPGVRLLGYGIGGPVDDLALDVFGHAVDDLPIVIERPAGLQASDVVAWVRAHGSTAVCLADLSPVAVARTRYLVKRLRQAAPELPILVGRWGGAGMPEDAQRLLDAGATHVGATVEETRAWLVEHAHTAPDGRGLTPDWPPEAEARPAVPGAAAAATAPADVRSRRAS